MIKSIHIENFRVLSGVRDFEFPQGIVGIVGPNGQGKSTLINSVAWAFYGAEALPLKARDPITWGAKQALVRVNLVLNDGTSWFVERSQKPTGVGKAKMWIEGHEPKAEGSAPVTSAITELLGVDREGFLISVFARQFELDRLRSMDPTPRMQTVLRLLGINQITKAVKLVREDGNEHRRALEAIRGHQMDLEAIEDELRSLETDADFLDQEIAAEQVEVDLTKSLLADLERQRIELEPKRKAYQYYQNDLQSRKMTVLFHESALNQARLDAQTPEPEKPVEPEYSAVQETSEKQIDQLKTAYLEVMDDYRSKTLEKERLELLRNGMSDTCPTCGRPFEDAAHIEREKEKITKTLAMMEVPIIELKAKAQMAKQDWDNAVAAAQKATQQINLNASSEQAYKAQVRQYELAMSHRAQVQERITRNEQELASAKTALEAIKEVQDVSDEDSRISSLLAVHNAALNGHTRALATASGQRKNLDLEIKRVAATLKNATERAGQAKKLTKTVEQHETAAAELQRFKENLIGGIIPSLNERASSLVSMMTDGKYDELSLTHDYEIEYRNHLGEFKNFLNLSGGEQTVFALALRLAISDLRAENLGVMFLDEAISNLSSEDGRQESVWEAIESLTSRFQQIFCITHVEAYKDRAPFTVRL